MGRIPEIGDTPSRDLVDEALGERVDVFVQRTRGGVTSNVSTYALISEVMRSMFDRCGIASDKSLKTLCVAVAEAAIGVVVTSDGFDVRRGPMENRTQMTTVDLRHPAPIPFEAVVTHMPPSEQAPTQA